MVIGVNDQNDVGNKYSPTIIAAEITSVKIIPEIALEGSDDCIQLTIKRKSNTANVIIAETTWLSVRDETNIPIAIKQQPTRKRPK